MVALLVEVVVDRRMDGGKFLQTLHLPNAPHRTFPSSKRQVRILRSIVQPAARVLLGRNVGQLLGYSPLSAKYRFAVDFREHLFQMKPPVRVCPHPNNPRSANLGCEHRAKSVPPKSNGFVADFDAALMQQVFDIPKRKWKSDVEHHRWADDLGARFEIPKWRAFYHPEKLRIHPARLKPV